MNAVTAGADCRQAQSRIASCVEASTNVVVGYVLALAVQQIIFPLLDVHTTLAQDSVMAGVFTLVSLLRSYLLRRLFEQLGSGCSLAWPVRPEICTVEKP